MRLAQIDPLRVEVIVPVSAFGTIQVGQRAVMRPESPMNGEYPATVTIVDGVADASSGTFRVRLGLPNEDYSLPSGLRCRVKFLPKDAPPEETVVAAPQPPRPYEMIKTAAMPAKSTEQICRTIGPFTNESDAERIMTTLTGQATQLRLREEPQNIAESYLLLAAPQPSLKDSRALTERMQAAGINDFYIFWRGPHKGRVSLGVYRNKVYAEERRALLDELGFDSDLVPRTEGESSRWWLDVELLPRIRALDLAAAGEVIGKAGLATSACANVVDHEPSGQTLAGTLSTAQN